MVIPCVLAMGAAYTAALLLLVLAGAALFWVSDLLILFLYFCEKKHIAVHIANLLTYYYAMFLLGASLAF